MYLKTSNLNDDFDDENDLAKVLPLLCFKDLGSRAAAYIHDFNRGIWLINFLNFNSSY